MNVNVLMLKLSIFALALLPAAGFGQTTPLPKLPVLTPQTPNAYAFQRAGEIPVNYNTGYLNYGIDLYEIDLGNLKVPIRLAYQNNGMRVDEIPTWVGHGWNLEFGGAITYSQRGLPDRDGMLLPGIYERYQRFILGQMDSYERRVYLEDVMKYNVDSEFDTYQFNFLGKTGEFFFKPDGTIQTSLDQGLKIVQTTAGFTITDESGNKFLFESKEHNQILAACGDPYLPYFNDNSAYYLTQIQTANNRTVQYQYTSYPLTYHRILYNYHHRPVPGVYCPGSDLSQSCNSYYLNNLLVSSITFDNGQIVFEHTPTVRLDIQMIDNTSTLPSLKSITIKHANGSTYGKYHFDQEYFGINQRLKLKKLRHTDGTTQDQEYVFSYYQENGTCPYIFQRGQDHAGYYNGGSGPYLFPKTDYSFQFSWPSSLYLADRKSDFLNGIFGLLEKVTYPTGGTSTFIYEPNQILLKKYRNLGTYSQYFEIPPAQFDGSNYYMNEVVTGSQITGSFTLTEETVVQVYAYKEHDQWALMDPEVSMTGPTGTITTINNFLNNLQLYCSNGACQNTATITMEPGTYSYTMSSGLDFDAFPLSMTFKIQGESLVVLPYQVGGGRIKKIVSDPGTTPDQVTEKEFEYDQREDSVTLRLRPVYHKNLQFAAKSGMNTSACGNEFTLYEQPINLYGTNILYNRVTEIDKGPQNEGTTVHRFKPNVTFHSSIDPYVEPQNVNWRYDEFQTIKFKNTGTTGSPVYQLAENNILDGLSDNSVQNNTGFRVSLSYTVLGTPDFNEYLIAGTVFNTERFYVKQQDNFLYDNANYLKNTSNFTLSPNHPVVVATQTTASSGALQTNRITYSRDFNTTGVTAGDALGIKLLKDNNINVPVETISIKKIGGTDYVTSGQLTTYKTNKPVPDKTYVLKIGAPVPLTSFTAATITAGALVKDSRYEERISITGYDEFNNPTELKKTNDMTMSYIWNYQKLKVVAECRNADVNAIAFTSFETPYHGGWTVSGALNATNKLTGTQSYLLTGGNITKSALPSNTYTVSYWSRGGSALVNGAGPAVTGKSVDGWTYYEHAITGTAVTVSGTVYIDELRLHPQSAFMSTYTYNPLTGLSSKCDEANKLTFYSYDSFNRLTLVLDQDKKILKKICYGMAGQVAICP